MKKTQLLQFPNVEVKWNIEKWKVFNLQGIKNLSHGGRRVVRLHRKFYNIFCNPFCWKASASRNVYTKYSIASSGITAAVLQYTKGNEKDAQSTTNYFPSCFCLNCCHLYCPHNTAEALTDYKTSQFRILVSFKCLILLQWSNQGIRCFRTAGSFPFCLNQMCNINTGKHPLPGNIGVAWPPDNTTTKKRVIFSPKERTAVLENQWLIWPISSHTYFDFSFYHFLIFSFFPVCRRKFYPLLTKEIVGCSHYSWTNKTSFSS